LFVAFGVEFGFEFESDLWMDRKRTRRIPWGYSHQLPGISEHRRLLRAIRRRGEEERIVGI